MKKAIVVSIVISVLTACQHEKSLLVSEPPALAKEADATTRLEQNFD